MSSKYDVTVKLSGMLIGTEWNRVARPTPKNRIEWRWAHLRNFAPKEIKSHKQSWLVRLLKLQQKVDKPKKFHNMCFNFNLFSGSPGQTETQKLVEKTGI